MDRETNQQLHPMDAEFGLLHHIPTGKIFVMIWPEI